MLLLVEDVDTAAVSARASVPVGVAFVVAVVSALVTIGAEAVVAAGALGAEAGIMSG